MRLTENISLALHAVRGQMLRTVLTVLIIAFGIMALVGILTAIDGIKNSLTTSLSSMGANSFTVRNRGIGIRIGNSGKKAKQFKEISFEEATTFKEQFNFPAIVGISSFCDGTAVIRYESEKTNPNVFVNAINENYLITGGYSIEEGRNITETEVMRGDNVVLIGQDIKNKLFKKTNPVGKEISINFRKYRVVGLLAPKGSTFGFGGDKACLIPLVNAKQYYGNQGRSWAISVKVANIKSLESAVEEATGLFRVIRGDKVGVESSFEITKSDSLANIFIEQLDDVTLAATLIGFITLLGAAIGLMNIMLVSVTERTREIGIRKSMGATRQNIKRQFLIEAIVICQIGGITGIILGILIGNAVGLLIGGGFIVPWLWITLGIVLCIVVGVLSGYYPASKASKLDPIESLRYE